MQKKQIQKNGPERAEAAGDRGGGDRGGGESRTTRKGARGALQRRRKKESGQGLIEYLILTALMGVAAIAIIRSLNQTVKSRFANAIYALQGKSQKAKTHSIKKEEYQRSDLSNFMSGAADRKKEKKK